ncbi:hypothetical protein DL96DRAFT_1604446 [Flagelloscypha sp. PMI_526]|nr:hypothetical protein DL96DRAFT_1604446 [Flagelloscypha sp. PMI_526]
MASQLKRITSGLLSNLFRPPLPPLPLELILEIIIWCAEWPSSHAKLQLLFLSKGVFLATAFHSLLFLADNKVSAAYASTHTISFYLDINDFRASSYWTVLSMRIGSIPRILGIFAKKVQFLHLWLELPFSEFDALSINGRLLGVIPSLPRLLLKRVTHLAFSFRDVENEAHQIMSTAVALRQLPHLTHVAIDIGLNFSNSVDIVEVCQVELPHVEIIAVTDKNIFSRQKAMQGHLDKANIVELPCGRVMQEDFEKWVGDERNNIWKVAEWSLRRNKRSLNAPQVGIP